MVNIPCGLTSPILRFLAMRRDQQVLEQGAEYDRLGHPREVAKPIMPSSSTPQMTRRRVMGSALAAGSLVLASGIRSAFSQTSGPFSLPPLPYTEGALAPVISSATVGFHYGKHHKAYVDNLNKAIEGTDLKD